MGFYLNFHVTKYPPVGFSLSLCISLICRSFSFSPSIQRVLPSITCDQTYLRRSRHKTPTETKQPNNTAILPTKKQHMPETEQVSPPHYTSPIHLPLPANNYAANTNYKWHHPSPSCTPARQTRGSRLPIASHSKRDGLADLAG